MSLNVTESKKKTRTRLPGGRRKNEQQQPIYDPFNLFEYDNRAIAFQALQRIKDNLDTSTLNSSPMDLNINNNTTNLSTRQGSSPSLRRRASVSSNPSSTPRSSNNNNQSRKSPLKDQPSSLPSSPMKRTNSIQSETPKSGSSTPRSSRPVFNRSNSDSQSLTSSFRPSSSKRRSSIGWASDSHHQSNCVCTHCGHEMKTMEEKKKPLITPSTEIFKALTEIEYEQALKQSMKGMEKVNLNDEEQLDLVAEILSDTLLKNDGLSLSKRKQKLKKATHFSQTETYFENRTDNTTIPTLQTLEQQFDFTSDIESSKSTKKTPPAILVNSNSNNSNQYNTNKKKPNVQIVRNIEEKSPSHFDEECKLISEPFITIQNNQMNFYPNKPTEVSVSRKKFTTSTNPARPIGEHNVNSKPPVQQYPFITTPLIREYNLQYEQPSEGQPKLVNSNETQTTTALIDCHDEDEDNISENDQYRNQHINTDPNCIVLNEESRNELVESAKRVGQDEIISMYINSKLKERSKKQHKRMDKKSSLSFLFPGLYRKIQTDLKLKRLESMDPYKKPLNDIVQEMKSLVERC